MTKKSVAVILASHGSFAKYALDSAEMIVGKQNNCGVLSVTMDLNLEEATQKMTDIYQSLDTSAGTVILVDILGGTPSNVSGNFCLTKPNVLVISGLNLPMLLDLFTNRQRSLEEIAESLQQSYQIGFQNITERFQEEEQEDDSEIL
ncbi:PTS sugar transporter subunit IIA [Bombilactobacillus bombi]|uniref:PTS sugar transporter subunit IIA n=1 Tax=Bombilactobacillus bombi TaxID=1303590 RepID=UPI000E58D3FE|nr:PTS sugar transporter subunit IIA [Bombilactobacillus bombi]AXX65226.1 PTS sugar transporter subunit IIA [Bombilactobacillus bombi]